MTKLTLSLGKSWIGVDRTGAMAWCEPLQRNFYLIWGRDRFTPFYKFMSELKHTLLKTI